MHHLLTHVQYNALAELHTDAGWLAAPCTAAGKFGAASNTMLSALGLQDSTMNWMMTDTICSEFATASEGLPF
jgi:hypothetical protein